MATRASEIHKFDIGLRKIVGEIIAAMPGSGRTLAARQLGALRKQELAAMQKGTQSLKDDTVAEKLARFAIDATAAVAVETPLH